MRERLQGLTFFRVVLVTLLLSAALFADSLTIEDLSKPTNLMVLSLIVGTYTLTIVYALYLRKPSPDLTALGYAQLTADFVTGALLVVTTGGLRASVFVPVFFLPIISGALILGRTSALYMSTCVAALITALSAFELGLFDDVDAQLALVMGSPRTILLEAGMLASFAYLLAFVSGRLAEQVDQAELQLARQRIDLDELRELNSNILSSMDSGLLTIDERGVIIYANSAATRILELSTSALLGHDLDAILPTLASNLTAQNERRDVAHTRPNGERLHLGFSTSELKTPNERSRGQIIIFQDLTLVRELEQNAKRAERLAAIGELAASIAHEIRNPLGAISGSVELLEFMADPTPDQQELMGVVVREVDRLNHLITQFLEYSKPRALKGTELDPVDLVREVVSMFRAGHPDALVEFDDVEGAETRFIDHEIVRQILWNLLNNAAEAQREGGDDARVRMYVGLETNSDSLVISVEDDGPGVPEDLSERIFEPFFTTKEKGTGLGLATIYRLANEHGGTIVLEAPTRLRGARFVVTLGDLPHPLETSS
jgi:two-component system sensor histidine kinase PilS (NtrC family)